MLPNPDILNDYPHGKFVLSNLAAKRAQQLRAGAPPLVHVESRHELTIALAEIAAGKIKPVLADQPDVLAEGAGVTLLVGESVPAELGLLLPGIEDSDDLGSIGLLGEEDAEEVSEVEEGMSLSALISEEGDEIATGEDSEDEEELSLEDLRDKEVLESGDEPEEA
jgi:DNA-directed RNA polymerase omega subunit